jgi:hypothetical protein
MDEGVRLLELAPGRSPDVRETEAAREASPIEFCTFELGLAKWRANLFVQTTI